MSVELESLLKNEQVARQLLTGWKQQLASAGDDEATQVLIAIVEYAIASLDEIARLRADLAAVVAERDAMRAGQSLFKAGESLLREMLAYRVAGVHLYRDDGELQDSTEHPWIDFRRDTPTEIQSKLRKRAMAKYQRSIDDAARAAGGES